VTATIDIWTDPQLEQIRLLKAANIERQQLTSAVNAVINHYLVNKNGEDHGFLFLSGPPGTGKSTVLKRAADEILRLSKDKGNWPVATFLLPENCSRKDFMSCCLEAVGDPAAHVGTRTSMEQRFKRIVEKKQVQILMVDELGHIVNSDDNEVNFVTADLLKLVTEGFRKAVVLAGLPNAVRVMQSNPQLSGRRHETIELRPLSLATAASGKECQFALLHYDEALPFADYCMLSDYTWMKAHMAASEGNPRAVVRLTRNAGMAAIRDDARRIEADHWQRAWADLRRDLDAKGKNPYSDLTLPPPVAKPLRQGKVA
jgi:Cdc6-like AAA superfamily ATPase